MTFKTFSPKAEVKDSKRWVLLDAQDKILGDLAARVAMLLRGKHKPTFSPHMDMGDYVVVINASKIRVTGKKEAAKEYFSHSGWLGHLKKKTLSELRAEKPERIITEAVSGMIPRNRLKRKVLSKLFIYAAAEHPHSGQNPTPITLGGPEKVSSTLLSSKS